jgi:NitT/TauT family transport system substrate-binding protein
VLFSLFSQAVKEAQYQRDHVTINMGVMKGPSGFSAAGIVNEDGFIDEMTDIDLAVYGSPNEVIAKLSNGELDMAALPTNVAAMLFNKGVPIKLAAITGAGMLQFITTDPTILTFDDLAGKSIGVPGQGATPDQLTQIFFSAFGYDSSEFLTLDYSISSAAQLTQMFIANKRDLVVLPEPFLTLAKANQENTIVLLDYQNIWQALTGLENYPITVLVVSSAFAEAHPAQLALALEMVEGSIDWVNNNPSEAAQVIEELQILTAALAEPSIPSCNLVYIPAQDAFESLDMYFNILQGFDYTSIGGAIPDETFYLEN